MKNSPLRKALALALAVSLHAQATDWPQFGFDAAHSGNNTSETILSRANVGQLTRRYQATLPSLVDSAPVYLANVGTASGLKNMLFMLSKSGIMMAIDAANGSVLWSHATTGAPLTTSSPAIDPGRAFVYAHGLDGMIHKYQVADGVEIITNGWPQVATLRPTQESANGGLAVASSASGNYLYSVMSGFYDGGAYQGHLTTINLGTNTQTVFNALCSNVDHHLVANECSSVQGAIWGRGGVTFDTSSQRIFVTTGNGPYNANLAGFDWGDSVLKLGIDGRGNGTSNDPYDSYTPVNFAYLYGNDEDLGSMTLAIVPPPQGSAIAHLGMQSGKDEALRLIDLDDMSGAGGPRNVGGELQLIPSAHEYNGASEQSAVWIDSAGDGSPWIFFASHRNGLDAYKVGLTTNSLPALTYVWSRFGVVPSTTSPIVANGVLYHISACSDNTNDCVVARNPLDGSLLWRSDDLAQIHWQSPIVADGVVYVADGDAKLWAFALANGAVHIVTPSSGGGGSIAPGTPQSVSDGATTTFTITPSSNHSIASVSGCGGQLSLNSFVTGPISQDCTVTALFSEDDRIFQDGFDLP